MADGFVGRAPLEAETAGAAAFPLVQGHLCQWLTLQVVAVLQLDRGVTGTMRGMTTPVHAHFSDSWWADSGVEEDRTPGGFGLWALIVLLALSPGIGVLLTILLD